MPESLCTMNDHFYSSCLNAHDWTCEGILVECGACKSIMANILTVMCGQTVFPFSGTWYTATKFQEEFGLLLALL